MYLKDFCDFCCFFYEETIPVSASRHFFERSSAILRMLYPLLEFATFRLLVPALLPVEVLTDLLLLLLLVVDLRFVPVAVDAAVEVGGMAYFFKKTVIKCWLYLRIFRRRGIRMVVFSIYYTKNVKLIRFFEKQVIVFA